MISRLLFVLAAGAGLAACQPAIPDSGQGAGFDNYFDAEQQQRDAALAGTVPAPSAVSAAPLYAANDGSAAATAAQTQRVLAATRTDTTPPGGLGNDASTNSGVAPLNASPSNPAPAVVNSGGISRENNFDAVSAQRDIQGDKAKIAANRAQYQVVTPEALPTRDSNDGPNIVAYALANKHPVGTSIYKRGGLNKAAKFERACGPYAGRDDLAQIEFLSRGGPEKDRAGMDPDGDGFACRWNPAPFRRVSGG